MLPSAISKFTYRLLKTWQTTFLRYGIDYVVGAFSLVNDVPLCEKVGVCVFLRDERSID